MAEYYYYDDGGTSGSCDLRVWITGIWYIGNATASICLLIFLTCFHHGMRCGDVQRRQRPRLVYPVNFLTNYDHRLAYLFCFIAMSGSVLQFFINGTPQPEGITDPSAKAFVSEILKYVSVCVVGLIFYPLPLCVSFDNLPMNVFGLLYTANWLALTVVGLITCPFGTLEGDIQGAINIPVVISLIALEIYFIKRIVRMCRRYLTADQTEKKFEETHYYVRVRYLLLPATAWVSRNSQVGTATKLFRRFYPSIPGFKYSTRIVCTVGLAVACMYQTCAYYVAWFLASLADDVTSLISGTFYSSCIVAFIIAVINSFFTLRNYRNNTRSLWIGDRSLTYNVQRKPPSVVVATLKFSGYTIAFLISGFIILQVVLWAIFIGFDLLFRNGLFVDLIRDFWLHLVMIVFVYIALRLFARCVFLQPNDDGALVLKNIHLFHIIAYFYVFLAVLLGVAGCILRILKAGVVGLVLIGRVDRCIFIRGFERFDRGYMAYRGYLSLEVSMTHPVLVSFCQLLSRSTTARKYRPGGLVVNETEDRAGRLPDSRSRLARNRWLVAYTLIRNPQLVYKAPLHSEKQPSISAVATDFKTPLVV